jgi:uncharacterized membrane protein
MAAPKQARPAGTRQGGGKSRDKGTRGGRPDPQPARTGSQGNGQRSNGQRSNGQRGGQATRPVRQGQAAIPATPETRAVPLWLQLTTWVLALAGFGVSIYLTVAHYVSPALLICSEKGLVNCAAVTTSPESIVFGVFPVAVLGLAFYVLMAVITSPWAWRASWPVIRWVRLGSVAVGMVFVLYLIYTELITLNAICLWCTSVHVITFLLFGLIVFSAAAGYGLPEPASRR